MRGKSGSCGSPGGLQLRGASACSGVLLGGVAVRRECRLGC